MTPRRCSRAVGGAGTVALSRRSEVLTRQASHSRSEQNHRFAVAPDAAGPSGHPVSTGDRQISAVAIGRSEENLNTEENDVTVGAEDRLMTIAEVAEMLGVPLRTLYQWRSNREGPVG